MKVLTAFGYGIIAIVFFGCATMPKGATAVQNFEKEKYLGTWYEIARFDFRFERDLNNTSAEYSILENGNIGVVNKGYNFKKNEWKEARGQARFRGKDSVGELEVSFSGPFYSAYNILALDDEYRYALVAGKSTEYLWILSREKRIPDEIKQKYLHIAEALGYDLSELIWVEHDK